jgi:hypothetical protein
LVAHDLGVGERLRLGRLLALVDEERAGDDVGGGGQPDARRKRGE